MRSSTWGRGILRKATKENVQTIQVSVNEERLLVQIKFTAASL